MEESFNQSEVTIFSVQLTDHLPFKVIFSAGYQHSAIPLQQFQIIQLWEETHYVSLVVSLLNISTEIDCGNATSSRQTDHDLSAL